MNMHTVHHQHLHDDCLEQTLFVPTCHRQRHGTELPGGIVHIHAVALEQQVHVGAAEVVHRVPEVEGAAPAPAQQAAADGVTLTIFMQSRPAARYIRNAGKVWCCQNGMQQSVVHLRRPPNEGKCHVLESWACSRRSPLMRPPLMSIGSSMSRSTTGACRSWPAPDTRCLRA